MVRTVTVKGKEYYVITTFLEADGIEAPVQVHINISHLSEEDKDKVKQHSNYFFNRIFKAKPKPKPIIEKPAKKAWYKFW